MTDSLREEIKVHIKTILIDQDCNWAIDSDVDKYTNSIFKIFEKRIDEMIKEVMSKNGTEIRQNGNRIDFRIIYDDQIATLKQVKEMLK